MKHLDKIGFTSCLLGVAGIPESYMKPKETAIALIMIIVGCILIFIGDVYVDIRNEKKNKADIKRMRDMYRHNARPYYLR